MALSERPGNQCPADHRLDRRRDVPHPQGLPGHAKGLSAKRNQPADHDDQAPRESETRAGAVPVQGADLTMPRRRQRASRYELVLVAAFVGLLMGGSLWLDQQGVLVTASVAAKRERVEVRFQPMGEWDRYHEVTTAFGLPNGGRSMATVRVSADRYATLRAGDSIEVRYLPQFPLLARTSDRSTASVVREIAAAFAATPVVG